MTDTIKDIGVFESEQLPFHATKIELKGFVVCRLPLNKHLGGEMAIKLFVEDAKRLGANAIIGYKVRDFIRVCTEEKFLVEREITGNAIYYE